MLLWALTITYIGICFGTSEPNAYPPKLVDEKGKLVSSYSGTISEDGQVLDITPPIKAQDEDKEGGASFICGFRLYSKSRMPFTVRHKEVETTAQIVVKQGERLDYERRHKYKVYLTAYDCGGPELESKKVPVFIRVSDVNEHAPVFDKESYMFEVDEGKVYPVIGKVHASDKDKSEDYGDVCSYELLDDEQLFTINKQGALSNTEALQYVTGHNHILEVVATDCSGKRSDPVLVTVIVNPPATTSPPSTTAKPCLAAWTGVDDVKFGGAVVRPFSSAVFEPCCDVEKLSVKLQLQTSARCEKNIATTSCPNEGVVDLLSSDQPWTKHLPSDTEGVYEFDGLRTAADVPVSRLGSVGDELSVLFWMKHDGDSSRQKQHILCYSDEHGMNRHHLSVFVHNSRLVLLLRREAHQEDDLEVFHPAEFRWYLPETSDGIWHHYSIIIDFPKVSLYIDGQEFMPTSDNPDIADDYPIHPTHRASGYKLTVGACWQGVESEYIQHLYGSLAALQLIHSSDVSRHVTCLNSCEEKLELKTFADLESGMTISYNTEQSELSIGGSTVSGVQTVLRDVTYSYSTHRQADITLHTNIKCSDHGVDMTDVHVQLTWDESAPTQTPDIPTTDKQPDTSSTRTTKSPNEIPVPNVDSDILQVQLGATANHVESEQEVGEGVRLYPDLVIVIKRAEGGSSGNEVRDVIDECVVRPAEKLDASSEGFMYPEHMLQSLHLHTTWNHANDGFVISGPAETYVFEDFLRQFQYYNIKPKELSAVSFSLECRAANHVSHPLTVEISVLHDTNELPGAAGPDVHVAQIQVDGGSLEHGSITAQHASSTSAGTVIAIVLSVSFAVFLVLLAVYKFRWSRSASRGGHHTALHVHESNADEMEWDTADVHVVVNPHSEYETGPNYDTEAADSDLDSCYREDDLVGAGSSDEDEQRNMEWDNSI